MSKSTGVRYACSKPPPLQPVCGSDCAHLLSHIQPFADCSPPGSSVHGIFQVRILEWAAVSFSRGSSQPRD